MKYALTIAGHDPSSGAGLTADLKTFEAHGVYGFSVCTALTVQNDKNFERVEWVKPHLIMQQIEVVMRRFNIRFVKIGIVESLEVLDEVLDYLFNLNQEVKIIWDPVLKASAGYEFHEDVKNDLLKGIVEKCFLITPNRPEMEGLFSKMFNKDDWEMKNHFLVKGGHGEGPDAIDLLYQSGEVVPISGPRLEGNKHGTGCVLSSAITANLLLGKSLKQACYEAKNYISRFIMSNDTLLGEHFYA